MVGLAAEEGSAGSRRAIAEVWKVAAEEAKEAAVVESAGVDWAVKGVVGLVEAAWVVK